MVAPPEQFDLVYGRLLSLLGLTRWGTLRTDGKSMMTSLEGVFAAGDIVRGAQNVDRKLIAGVTVFDVYEGKNIDAGKKSIAIAVTLQPREKTMTDEEIEAAAKKIVAEVSKRTGGVLRG